MAAISDAKIRNLKPKTKQYKIGAGRGLYLLVTPSGGKLWRFKYRMDGKEKVLSIGEYPTYSLVEAETERNKAKVLIEKGIDPSQKKKEKALVNKVKRQSTFKTMAMHWYEKRLPEWTPRHGIEVMSSLTRDIFPFIGNMPVNEISTQELLKTLRKIEKRGALVMVRKVRQRCEAIFNFAIIEGKLDNNPAIALRGKDTFKASVKKHYRALDRKDLPVLMKDIDLYNGEPTTKLGLKLIIYTFVRTSELRFAQWPEIDWDNKIWTIPESRMKANRELLVPLSDQALAILKELQVHTGEYKYIFASYHRPNTQPFSENALLVAIKNMGYFQTTTVHGFRSTASTALNEYGFKSDWIEKQLAHEQGNKVRAAYNRAEYIEDRTRMMQAWADIVDDDSSNIIPIRKKLQNDN